MGNSDSSGSDLVFGRPRSEITTALQQCLPSEPMTWKGLAGQLGAAGLINLRSPAECRLVRRTVDNMARRGELARVGKRAGDGGRPMTLFIVASLAPAAPGGQALEQALRAWVR